jgi:tartrate dehydratase alpha subunit/fumarate hydratase class I-like protein
MERLYKEVCLELVKGRGQTIPPITGGKGIGGKLEQSALLAKKALLEPFAAEISW